MLGGGVDAATLVAALGAGPPVSQRANPDPLTSSPAWRIGLTPDFSEVNLHKILFYFEAFVHESIILALLPSTCIARITALLLHVYCILLPNIRRPPPPPLLYAVHHTIYAMPISCTSQSTGSFLPHFKSSLANPVAIPSFTAGEMGDFPR